MNQLKQRMQRMHYITLTVIASLALLSGCTQEEDNISSSNTRISLRIQASIDNNGWGGTTRLDENDGQSSFEGDDLIGISGSVDKNIPYCYSEDLWCPSDDDTPIYFNSMYEEFTAYYPYDEDAYAGKTLEPKDYLFAKANITSLVKYDNDTESDEALVEFEFKHVMSKLVINLQQYSDYENLKVSLQQQGTFDTATGIATATGEATELESYTAGEEILIFPQASVTVSFTCYGEERSVTIKPTSGFEAGTKYSYTIKRPDFIEDLAKVLKYDYVLNDGRFLNSSCDITDYKSLIVGVVFWKGDPTASDTSLKSDYPECTHGLIVALDEISSSIKWQETAAQVSSTTDITGTNAIQGYYNTLVIKSYNESCDSENKVLPVAALEMEKIDGLSPWYVPSIYELCLMLEKMPKDFSFTTDSGIFPSISSELEETISNAGGTKITDINNWSSSEYSESIAYSLLPGIGIKDYIKASEAHVRAVCAF